LAEGGRTAGWYAGSADAAAPLCSAKAAGEQRRGPSWGEQPDPWARSAAGLGLCPWPQPPPPQDEAATAEAAPPSEELVGAAADRVGEPEQAQPGLVAQQLLATVVAARASRHVVAAVAATLWRLQVEGNETMKAEVVARPLVDDAEADLVVGALSAQRITGAILGESFHNLGVAAHALRSVAPDAARELDVLRRQRNRVVHVNGRAGRVKGLEEASVEDTAEPDVMVEEASAEEFAQGIADSSSQSTASAGELAATHVDEASSDSCCSKVLRMRLEDMEAYGKEWRSRCERLQAAQDDYEIEKVRLKRELAEVALDRRDARVEVAVGCLDEHKAVRAYACSCAVGVPVEKQDQARIIGKVVEVPVEKPVEGEVHVHEETVASDHEHDQVQGRVHEEWHGRLSGAPCPEAKIVGTGVEKIDAQVVAQGEDGPPVLQFRMKMSTNFRQLMHKWCEHHSIAPEHALFLAEDRTLLPDDTPQRLGWNPTGPLDERTIRAQPRTLAARSSISRWLGGPEYQPATGFYV